jgi:parallel beta-helix repeat protein
MSQHGKGSSSVATDVDGGAGAQHHPCLQQMEAELASMTASLGRMAKLVEEEKRQLAQEREDLQRQRNEFEAMRQRVNVVNGMTQTHTKINVAGRLFECSITTLTAEKGSMLEAMFSGRHSVDRDPDTGAVFIDRDPDLFEVVLQYLRDTLNGTTFKPPPDMDTQRTDALAAEAGFYGLSRLEKLIVASKSIVVAQDGSGRFVTVRSAIEAARPGDTIRIRPGIYFENIVVDSHVEIVGDGENSDAVVLCYSGDHVVFASTDRGSIRNCTIIQQGEDHHCVCISKGCVCIEGCELSSSGWACVGICGESAHPYLCNNRLTYSNDNGIIVLSKGKGVIEGNEITGYTLQGVEVREEGNPVIRNNHIHGGKDSGIYINTKGRGWIEGNSVNNNGVNGIAVKFEGQPQCLRNNRIFGNRHRGIVVSKDSTARIEDSNRVTGNEMGDIVVET